MARAIKIDNSILKRKQYKKPQREIRSVVCRILIVCEGKKTEPNYFKAFNKVQRGTVVYEIETHGEGKNTIGVVDQAIRMREAAGKERAYDSVWAVFDRDSFPPEKFDNAIHKAIANNINCAWSNEAFELWYLLHFHNRITSMCRDEYKKAISDAVNNSPKNKQKRRSYEYAKNAGDSYEVMNRYGSQDDAIKWAKDLHEKCNDGRFHTHNPCTTVYQLVLQLMGKDDEFNTQLIAKIDTDLKNV